MPPYELGREVSSHLPDRETWFGETFALQLVLASSTTVELTQVTSRILEGVVPHNIRLVKSLGSPD